MQNPVFLKPLEYKQFVFDKPEMIQVAREALFVIPILIMDPWNRTPKKKILYMHLMRSA